MTQVTAGADKAKTAKVAASPFGLLGQEIPKFDLPNMEMPEAFREMTEKGVAQAKDTYRESKGGRRAGNGPPQEYLYDRCQELDGLQSQGP